MTVLILINFSAEGMFLFTFYLESATKGIYDSTYLVYLLMTSMEVFNYFIDDFYINVPLSTVIIVWCGYIFNYFF